MSLCMTPEGVKNFNDLLLRESSTSMYDSCGSQVFQCITPPGVKYFNLYDSCRSQVSQCMTPAGVKYVTMHDSCWSQVFQCHPEHTCFGMG